MLIGDATKAKTQLGWEPNYNLDQLVSEMVAEDLKLMKKDVHLSEAGFDTQRYVE